MPLLALVSPQVAHAASVGELVSRIEQAVINPLISILFALAFLMFVWGVVAFLFKADDENARTQGKHHMLWGLAGMLIMMGVFAIINIITNTLGIDNPY